MMRWTRRRARHLTISLTVLTGLVCVMILATGYGCGKKPQPTTEVTQPPPPPPPPVKPVEPPPPPPQKPVEITLTDVFFDYDKSNLRDDARQTLNVDAQALQQNGDTKALLEGHCDERGTVEYNLALGERRAQSAKNFLVQYGIDAGRINTISYGKERPFVQGHDESAWSQNRRVHFVVQK